MKTIRYRSYLLLAATAFFLSHNALESCLGQDVKRDTKKQTAKKTEPSKFLRLVEKNGKPVSLDTTVTTYKSKEKGGVQVDLIGAVHIGEGSYYKQLNEIFDQYDVLLYELVAPEGTVIPKGGRASSSNPVSFLQKSMQNMLGLESQLEKVDYTKKHFVRADMTPSQIAKKMEERGESALSIALSTLSDVVKQQNIQAQKLKKSGKRSPIEDLSIFDMMGNPQKMKLAMATQFAESGSLESSLGGSLNQMLIVDRNEEAMRGLQKQIAKGKKKIGIFYGAAHLPDFERRLAKDFDLKKSGEKWIVAWDLSKTAAPAKKSDDPATMLLELLNEFNK